MKMRINSKSLSLKVSKLLEKAEDGTKDYLKEVAEDLTLRTPVDTGAYAESFSVTYSNDSGGRMKTSKGKERNQDRSRFIGIALSNMNSDIDKLDLKDNLNTSVSFKNRAPHAGAVGIPNTVEDKYLVFDQVFAKRRS